MSDNRTGRRAAKTLPVLRWRDERRPDEGAQAQASSRRCSSTGLEERVRLGEVGRQPKKPETEYGEG